MKTVQVTSEAKANPTMTAWTMMSAFWNISQGDSSLSATGVDFSTLAAPSAGGADASEATGAGAAAGWVAATGAGAGGAD
jgi:hypothetical protein